MHHSKRSKQNELLANLFLTYYFAEATICFVYNKKLLLWSSCNSLWKYCKHSSWEFCVMCIVKVNDEIKQLVTYDKRTQRPDFESTLTKKMFFFPNIPEKWHSTLELIYFLVVNILALLSIKHLLRFSIYVVQQMMYYFSLPGLALFLVSVSYQIWRVGNTFSRYKVRRVLWSPKHFRVYHSLKIMASGINIYSQLVISLIRIGDITNSK